MFYLYRGCEICKFSIAFKYKHKIKWPKLLRKCIFRNSKKILALNKYESVWFIIYTNFVVQTVKNSNPLEVFCENVLLSAIIHIHNVKDITKTSLKGVPHPSPRPQPCNVRYPNFPLFRKMKITLHRNLFQDYHS